MVMMYFQALFWASCVLFLAVTSATDVGSYSKGIKSENLSPDIASYRNGWWDKKNFRCPSPWGQFPDPDDCSSYYVCSGRGSSHKRCRGNKHFDMYRKVCLPKALAICDSKDKGKTTKRTTPSYKIGSTTSNDDQFSCPSLFGLFPHPKNCEKYFSCAIFLPSLKTCPPTQLFDAVKKDCQPEDTVHCGSRERPTTLTSRTPTTVSTVSTTTEADSTPKPTTIPDIITEVSTTASPPITTTETSTSTEQTTTSVTETPVITTVRPTGPPDHDCDKDDLDCIITETGDISDWFTCPQDMGSHPHPSSDKLFIFCLNWKPSVKKCGQDLVFSKTLLTCTSP